MLLSFLAVQAGFVHKRANEGIYVLDLPSSRTTFTPGGGRDFFFIFYIFSLLVVEMSDLLTNEIDGKNVTSLL